MDKRIILGSVIMVTVYMFIPWVLTRIFGLGIFRRGKSNGVAFTFDDGPNSFFTPELLRLLKQYNVKATFFVLGSRAKEHPELIKQIHQDGHLVGIHNYTHKSNWLMTPWSVKHKHVMESADIIENIIGVRPNFYRPPWGIINVFDFFLLKQFHIVLWSVMPSDWRSKQAGDEHKLKQKLLRTIKAGSVVLLHDSGDTFGANTTAPQYMMQALEEVIIELSTRNHQFLRVDELMNEEKSFSISQLSLPKRIIVTMWLAWEKLFIKLFHIKAIDDQNTLLRIRVREYKNNQPIQFIDGDEIRKGDLIAELHLDNKLLFKLGMESRSTVHLTVQLIRRTEQLLPKILQMILTHPQFKDVKGLYGITMIYRGTKQLGFTVLDMPSGVFSFFTSLYLRLLMYVIHPSGKERLKSKSDLLIPKIIAISKRELMNRYIA